MRGLYTALVTPFCQDGKIDWPALKKIIKNQVDAKVTGLVPCGTTGESPTLSKEETKELILFTLNELKGTGVKTIAGTGSNSTAQTVEFSQWASQQGVDGVLIIAPYYNRPSQTGLREHYLAVANSVSCEVIVYHHPGRTGVSLTASTIATLAEHPKINTLKDATGNITFASEVFARVNKASNDGSTQALTHLDILAGDDSIFLPTLAIGGQGVISVASNFMPRGMMALLTAFQEGRIAEATQLHQKFFPVFRDLNLEINPVPVKHALSYLGWCRNGVRLPLALMQCENIKTLEDTLKECKMQREALL